MFSSNREPTVPDDLLRRSSRKRPKSSKYSPQEIDDYSSENDDYYVDSPASNKKSKITKITIRKIPVSSKVLNCIGIFYTSFRYIYYEIFMRHIVNNIN